MTQGISVFASAATLAICLLAPHVMQSSRPPLGTTLYVDDDAPLGGDGLAWISAFRHLQDALTTAQATNIVEEIRLAQGTYTPDQGEGLTAGDRNATFRFVSGIALRGGYGGLTESDPDARNISVWPSILSGDLLGNDGANFTNYEDNTYRIATVIDPSPATLIEGVTFRSAQWTLDSNGGGLYVLRGNITIDHCVFRDNHSYKGGGIAGYGVNIHVRACSFNNNRSQGGGGMYLRPASGAIPARLLLEDSDFDNNDTATYGEDGGAVSMTGDGAIHRCVFTENLADDGGAVSLGGNVEVSDCVFRGNRADFFGAAYRMGTFVRCLFEDNWAARAGGAYGETTIDPVLHARFLDCTFINNSTAMLGGGATYGGREFVNCRFLGNDAGVGSGDWAGGGAILVRVPTTIVSCDFSGNNAPGVGGAVAVSSFGSAGITNCTFSANQSDHPSIVAHAVYGGTICNSVFGPHPGQPLASLTSIDYSSTMLRLPESAVGPGNIIGDPRFVDPLGPDGIAGTEDDDLRLRADSPCIDAGDTTALPADQFDLDGDGDTAEPLPLDNAGNRRVLRTPHVAGNGMPAPGTLNIVDMGAFEYRRPPDVFPSIGDGYVDVDDLIGVILNWGECDRDKSVECPVDIDGNGEVGIGDLIAVILGWG